MSEAAKREPTTACAARRMTDDGTLLFVLATPYRCRSTVPAWIGPLPLVEHIAGIFLLSIRTGFQPTQLPTCFFACQLPVVPSGLFHLRNCFSPP